VLLTSKYTAAAVLILVVFALGSSAGLAQQFSFSPTTTLSAETANNTSAADSFTTLSNGAPAPGNVSKLAISKLLYPGAKTAIYAHFMPWFGQSSHINVGYISDDATQVHKQVVDMISRGMGGVIVDWYGPDSPVENGTTLLMKTESENNPGFAFAVQEDVGALNKCASTTGCNITQQLISDLTYAYNTYEGSPAYMTLNGRPVVLFFGVDQYTIDWPTVRSSVPGTPYFVFNGFNGLTHPQADGYFTWVQIDSSSADDESLSVLSKFYSAIQGTGDLTYGAGYIGFNESAAPWVKSNPRIMNQHCGQTWLDTFNTIATSGYSSSNPLQALQVVTWNDYEEGTEIESGIGNCITVSPSTTGASLNWAIAGNENAVDHYTVFISLDGQQLMKLADIAVGTHILNLSSFNLVPSTNYQLFVEAVGLPSFQNVMSASVSYLQAAPQQPNAVLTLSATTGSAPLSVTASTSASSSPNGSIVSSTINFGDGTAILPGPSVTHIYQSPGTFTVTASVTDSLNVSASTTQKVTVSPAALNVVLKLNATSGTAPLNVSASLASSTSPDGTITGGTINFGDGSPTVSGLTASHTYSVPGTFTVTASVTDSLNVSASTTQKVTVSPAALNIILKLSARSGTLPLNVSASLASSTSPDGSITGGTINFGDGSPTVSGLTASHTYSVPGSFTVTASLTDSVGGTASTTQTVSISRATPSAVLTVAPASGKTSLTVSASLAKSSSPDATISAYSINFGDGTTVAAATAAHTYYVPGTFTVTGSVTDSLGASAFVTHTVSVTQGCSINSTNRTVTICAPSANASVSSPVQVVADATDSKAIKKMAILVDGKQVFSQQSTAKLVDVPVTMSTGSHTVEVQVTDSAGSFSKSIAVKVH
jgi:PKD repeat protein